MVRWSLSTVAPDWAHTFFTNVQDRGEVVHGFLNKYAGAFWGHERNAASRQDPAAGQAPILPGVHSAPENDVDHHSVLDGARYTAVANHPDGRFAHNTAATSSFSRLANHVHYHSGGNRMPFIELDEATAKMTYGGFGAPTLPKVPIRIETKWDNGLKYNVKEEYLNADGDREAVGVTKVPVGGYAGEEFDSFGMPVGWWHGILAERSLIVIAVVGYGLNFMLTR